MATTSRKTWGSYDAAEAPTELLRLPNLKESDAAERSSAFISKGARQAIWATTCFLMGASIGLAIAAPKPISESESPLAALPQVLEPEFLGLEGDIQAVARAWREMKAGDEAMGRWPREVGSLYSAKAHYLEASKYLNDMAGPTTLKDELERKRRESNAKWQQEVDSALSQANFAAQRRDKAGAEAALRRVLLLDPASDGKARHEATDKLRRLQAR